MTDEYDDETKWEKLKNTLVERRALIFGVLLIFAVIIIWIFFFQYRALLNENAFLGHVIDEVKTKCICTGLNTS